MSVHTSIITDEPDVCVSIIFRNFFEEDKGLSYKSGENILYHIFMRQNPHYLEFLLRGFVEHTCLENGIKSFDRDTFQRLKLCEEVEKFIPKFLEKRQELINEEEKEMLQQEPLQELLKKVVQPEEEIPRIRLVNTLPLKQEYQLYSLTGGGKLFLERVFGKKKVFQTAVGSMVQGSVSDLIVVLEGSFV